METNGVIWVPKLPDLPGRALLAEVTGGGGGEGGGGRIRGVGPLTFLPPFSKGRVADKVYYCNIDLQHTLLIK